MGPRLFSRGKRSYFASGFWIANALQWGRDCSVAESVPRRLAAVQRLRASMGPRLFSRGKGPGDRQLCRLGPCFNGAATVQSRKEPAERLVQQVLFSASMGPRLFSRGKFSRPLRIAIAYLLQWGRDCSVAERSLSSCSKSWTDKLQWGRDCSVAESDVTSWTARSPCSASMGPRLFSRGKAITGDDAWDDEIASMGPRLFSRGKMDNYGWTGAEYRRFNGAATVQSRKGWLRPATRFGVRTASMGPRLFSRGKADKDCEGFKSNWLQWGRDCSVAERDNYQLTRDPMVTASMGPRLFSRGKAADSGGWNVDCVASMGPRLFSRGKSESNFQLMKFAALQWGRDCSVAERAFNYAPNDGLHKLQWGRDCSVAERRVDLIAWFPHL